MTVRPPKLLMVGVLLAGSIVAGADPATAAPTDAAFNSPAGALAVDYAGYLSKHDIVYNRANTNPLHGLTVGNGRTGAIVWQQNGLTMQTSGVHLSQQSTYALDADVSVYQQRLSLYDGTARPLSAYTATTLTGSPDQGPKSLQGTASTLGLGASDGGLVNDTDLTYDANWFHTTARGYGDYNDDTHHSTTVGATASYTFTGTGIEYLSERFSDTGTVALRAQANTLFVQAGNAGAAPLVAAGPSVGAWETFARVDNLDGTVSLRATVNNLYVVAENGGAAPLIANRTAIGPWEKFTLTPS